MRTNLRTWAPAALFTLAFTADLGCSDNATTGRDSTNSVTSASTGDVSSSSAGGGQSGSGGAGGVGGAGVGGAGVGGAGVGGAGGAGGAGGVGGAGVGGAGGAGGVGGAGGAGGAGGVGGAGVGGAGVGGAGGAGGAADLTPPVVTLAGPANGSLLRTARLYVPVKAEDEGGLKRVGFVLNGGVEVDLNAMEGSLSFQGPVDARPTRGDNTLTVFAEDLAGNRTEVPLDTKLERRLAAGGSHTGAVAAGKLLIWGRNNLGQLGLGAGDTTSRFEPTLVPGLDLITAIDLRQNQSLALAKNGSLFVWGNNADGRLGLGAPGAPDTTSRSAPTEVPGLSGVLAATFGYDHTLVLLEDGTVRAFGDNSLGQLGDGSVEDRSYPVVVAGLDDVIQIIAGSKHSAALRRDGTVWTWGRNQYGSLGQGSADMAVHPMAAKVAGLTDVTHIASGRDHMLALRADGTVVGWGLTQNGQVGSGMSGADATALTPVPVVGLMGAVAVMADGNYSFALRNNGTAVGWGQNFNGQLGIASDDTSDRNAPDAPLALPGISDLEPGATHAVGLGSDGSFYSWGWSTNGSLGRPNLLNNWAYPVPGQVTLP